MHVVIKKSIQVNVTVNQLSTCVTVMTETVFSQSSEASSTELCLQCPCMLSKILRLFSRLFWKKKDEDFSCHKNVYVVFFLYKWYHSFYGSFDHHTTPSYTVSHKITMVSSWQRRYAGWPRMVSTTWSGPIRSDRKPFEKPTFALFWEWQQVNSTSASCFLPIRAKKQMLPGRWNETSFLGLFSDLAHGLLHVIDVGRLRTGFVPASWSGASAKTPSNFQAFFLKCRERTTYQNSLRCN